MLTLTPHTDSIHVLCLGAHPDDIEIGCGGTMLGLAERPGTRFTSLVLTGDDQREQESTKALQRLAPHIETHFARLIDGRLPAQWQETKDALERLGADCRPDVIFAPRVDDAHQDHRLVGQLASTVWRDAVILHYEIAKWDGDMGAPNTFVGLSVAHAREKVDVLNACFPSQVDREWWDDEAFLGLMRLRGIECRAQYAEAFYSSKLLLDLGTGG
ncbi:MAG: PIG-L deacetylase family protein [Nocardioides sp.]|uniref:PIG-L deacetylase family protein n=1 Tax=Nocardioides sp. TaxID=35761 RepID=UPI00326782B0